VVINSWSCLIVCSPARLRADRMIGDVSRNRTQIADLQGNPKQYQTHISSFGSQPMTQAQNAAVDTAAGLNWRLFTFRSRSGAKPSSPVPTNSRDPGCGTARGRYCDREFGVSIAAVAVISYSSIRE
jgi:hypothetical protein